jgi:hypothetical protein
VGLLDALLGGKRRLKLPAADRLFAMTTAAITLETVGLKSRGVAAIVFQQLATADFAQIVKDAQDLLESAAKDTGTQLEQADDEFGYRWIVFRDEDFDDLVTSVNTVAGELQAGGYGDRLLAAVFAFEGADGKADFIYNFKRGYFYPFCPTGKNQRDTERELRLKAQLASDLPIEPELERWFPLWGAPIG